MLEDDPHLSQTFVQAASRPHFISTSEYSQWNLSGAEQRCQICSVCHRWLKAREFFYFPMCKQSAPKPLSCWPHFCLTSISTAMRRTFQIHQCYFFLYWRQGDTCICTAFQRLTNTVLRCLSSQECLFRWERSPGLAGITPGWRQEAFGCSFWWWHFVIQRPSPVSVMELSRHTSQFTWLLCFSFPLAENQHSYIPG